MFIPNTVKARLLFGFIAVALVGAVVASIGIYNMGRISDSARILYEKELLGLSYAKEANVKVIHLGRALRSALLASRPEERDRFIGITLQAYAEMQANLDKARPLFYTERGMAAFRSVDDSLQGYKPLVDGLIERMKAEDLQQRRETVEFLFTRIAPQSNLIDEKLDALVDAKQDNAARAAAASAELYQSNRNLMICLVVLSLALGIGIGTLITRRLTGQLGGEPDYAAGIAERIAKGDLTVDVQVKDGDRGSMLFAMKQMRDSLARIVTEVRTGTASIASASGQIAAGNLDLSSRTEEQASTLEETASSMEELTSTVRQNADNARQANHQAEGATDVAARAGAAVADVVRTMGAIHESANKIVDIITVIDGIAFQTNILALNAAVEAARAGEQGRGFAVVASEVRNLAQRSAAAAKEIKGLIGNSVEQVESGSRVVEQAGATMKEVVANVRNVSSIIGEISQASQEQSAGIEQINQAVLQMDQVTQQNASLVEEAAAASEALQEQARRLAELVSFFQVEKDEPQQAGAPVRHAATVRQMRARSGQLVLRQAA